MVRERATDGVKYRGLCLKLHSPLHYIHTAAVSVGSDWINRVKIGWDLGDKSRDSAGRAGRVELLVENSRSVIMISMWVWDSLYTALIITDLSICKCICKFCSKKECIPISLKGKCSYMYTYSYVSELSLSCTCLCPHPDTLSKGYFIEFFILPQSIYQIQCEYGVFGQDLLRKARQRFLETK